MEERVIGYLNSNRVTVKADNVEYYTLPLTSIVDLLDYRMNKVEKSLGDAEILEKKHKR